MNYDLIFDKAKELLSDNPTKWEHCEKGIKIEDTVYPLMPWYYNRQLREIHNLAIETKALRDVCSYKSQRFEAKDTDIYSLLYEELDVCEWLLDDKIISVFADINSDKYMTLILKTSRGILCNILISTTLPIGTNPITKHEIVGKEGMISERPVCIQIPEQGTYLFSDEKIATYTDNDLYMLGLTPNEVMAVDNIMDLVRNKPNVKHFEEKNARNEFLIACVKKSAQSSNIVIVGGI